MLIAWGLGGLRYDVDETVNTVYVRLSVDGANHKGCQCNMISQFKPGFMPIADKTGLDFLPM